MMELAGIQKVPVSLIIRDPGQPRTEFKQEDLDMLADSIKNSGLLQPISLRKNGGDHLIIIAGERRFRACCQLGWDKVPAIVHEVDDKSFRNMQLLENFVRKDIGPVELARAFKQRLDEGQTDAEIAAAIGKKPEYIRWLTSILSCNDQALHLVELGQLPVWVAWRLARLSANGQNRALRTFQLHKYSAGEMVSICEKIYAVEHEIKLFDDTPLTNDEIKVVRSFEKTFILLSNRLGKVLKLAQVKPGIEIRLDRAQVKEAESRLRLLDKILMAKESIDES